MDHHRRRGLAGSAAVIRAALLLAVLALVAGCGTAPVTVYKGGDGAGNYLAGGMLLRHEGAAVECQHPNALACMYVNRNVTWGGQSVEQFFLVVNGSKLPDFTARHLEVLIHEGCHYVAGAWDIVPDPCHREDMGVIR